MKKKLAILIAIAVIQFITNTYAQSWTVGDNALAGPGADRLFGSLSPNNKNLVFINGNTAGVGNKRGRITLGVQWGIGTSAPLARFHINSAAGESPKF